MKHFGLIVAAFLIVACGLEAQGDDKGKGTEKKTSTRGEKKSRKDGRKATTDAKKPGEKKGEKGPVYDSPEKAFEAFLAAAAKGDGKTVCACLTKDAATTVAGNLALTTLFIKGNLEKSGGKNFPESIKETVEALSKALEKYGLSKEEIEKNDFKFLRQTVEKNGAAETVKRLGGLIKDRCAYLGATLGALSASSAPAPFLKLGMAKDATLKDLKVTGDTATATVDKATNPGFGPNMIRFSKEGAGWRISRLPNIGMAFSGGNLQPPRFPPPPGVRPGAPPKLRQQ